MDCQDWTTVTVKRRAAAPPARLIAAAQAAIHTARLDSDADDLKRKKRRLAAESRQALVAARCAEKKSQRDIERELAFPVNMLRDWEAGTSAPTGAQISALQRRFAAAHLVLRVEVV